ncbi:uncharacterized protein LOC125652616 isoform X2 [Ostrea edulis]|nr:uncharacterized protein LOC125652616 isoform X2 [Ostrea edulis]XP_048737905.1 uncharacterized protein LOC125652616 isoform X2 [Ostrea edulis]XP_056022506.1 uncharacterized protein LOC125652616 isoform X2 [Ostrea edulis]
MNTHIGLQHLLFWQAYHFCNWISAVPLDKPTTISDSVGNYLDTKGDLSNIKSTEKLAAINGNYSAGVTTAATSKTYHLLIHADDTKRTPKISNDFSTTELPANHSVIDYTNNENKSATLKPKHETSKETNFHPSIKKPSEEIINRILRDDKLTTALYNEIDLLQAAKSENETIPSENNSTVDNGTLISEHNAVNESRPSNESTNDTVHGTNSTTLSSSTTETTLKTTVTNTTQPTTKNNVTKATSTTKTSPSNKQTTHEQHVLQPFTGFAENVPVRHQYPHHTHHHLNLVPMEDSPFGNLLWKDKKYLISVLVPISIGIVGAGCIIGMAYVARYCYRNERQVQMMKERITQSQAPHSDNIVLLDDSDDEF